MKNSSHIYTVRARYAEVDKMGVVYLHCYMGRKGRAVRAPNKLALFLEKFSCEHE